MKLNSDLVWIVKGWVVVLAVLGAIYLGAQAFDKDFNKPEPTQTVERTWTKADSKAYAQLKIQDMADKEFGCLKALWGKESAWNPKAYNPVKVGGLNAGGIPQLLGLSVTLSPAKQIDRGFKYIKHRYGTPCGAWTHFKHRNWY